MEAGSGARRGYEPVAGCKVWTKRERSPTNWKVALGKGGGGGGDGKTAMLLLLLLLLLMMASGSPRAAAPRKCGNRARAPVAAETPSPGPR